MEKTEQAQAEYPRAAYALSLVGGSLVVAGSLIVAVMAGLAAALAPRRYYGYGPMPAFAWAHPALLMAVGMAAFGLISGIIVLASAIMLRRRPSESTTWGALILIFSVLSFFGMGGFVVGAVLGIVGGIMAISWRQ